MKRERFLLSALCFSSMVLMSYDYGTQTQSTQESRQQEGRQRDWQDGQRDWSSDRSAYGRDTGLTPVDQSETAEDRTITQRIRQSIVADNALSMTAKNVKIITINGNVTLRGEVKSSQEKASIERKAQSVSGVRNVENQLEISPEGDRR